MDRYKTHEVLTENLKSVRAKAAEAAARKEMEEISLEIQRTTGFTAQEIAEMQEQLLQKANATGTPKQSVILWYSNPNI